MNAYVDASVAEWCIKGLLFSEEVMKKLHKLTSMQQTDNILFKWNGACTYSDKPFI